MQALHRLILSIGVSTIVNKVYTRCVALCESVVIILSNNYVMNALTKVTRSTPDRKS